MRLTSSMTPELEKAYIDTLTIALSTGYQILSRGGGIFKETSNGER